MRADGMSQREVAGELGVAVAEVREAERWLADAVGRLA
jgi:Trp operon repressor